MCDGRKWGGCGVSGCPCAWKSGSWSLQDCPGLKELDKSHIWLWDHRLQPWPPHTPRVAFLQGERSCGDSSVSHIWATSSDTPWVLQALTFCCLLPVVPKAALFLITWQVAGTIFYQNQHSSAHDIVQIKLSKAYGKFQSHFCLLPCFYFNYNFLREEGRSPPLLISAFISASKKHFDILTACVDQSLSMGTWNNQEQMPFYKNSELKSHGILAELCYPL